MWLLKPLPDFIASMFDTLLFSIVLLRIIEQTMTLFEIALTRPTPRFSGSGPGEGPSHIIESLNIITH